MLVVFFKSVFTFILVFVVLRLMGKRQLGEMQPYELVITLIIAEVACIPMNDPYIPFYNGIIPIVTLAVIDIVLSFINKKSLRMRKILNGNSIIVIDKNGMNYANMKKLNVNVNDLIESVRSSGYMDLSEIEYAIIETNGKMCIVEKSCDPTQAKPAYLPLALLIDGKYLEDNLSTAGAKIPEITSMLKKKGIKNIKDILYLDVRQDGSVFVSPKYEKSFVEKIKLAGGANW